MRRPFIFLFPLLLGQCVDGSTPAQILTWNQLISVSVTPIAIDPADHRIGALTLEGAWKLTSDTRSFGGLSALDVSGEQFTALGDTGTIVRFRMGRLGTASDASIVRVPDGCGRVTRKTYNDTESLTHDNARNLWWIGFERRNAVCRTNADFTKGETVRVPTATAAWPRKRGPESMVRLRDGRFLVIAENVSATSGISQAVIFDRDPTDPAAIATPLGYQPPTGFKPTDITQLPDGRLLVLNRRFAVWSLFSANMVLLDPIAEQPARMMQGRIIARFEPPGIVDNFEGLSVTVENGRPIIWMVSDNNFMRWQRTLLLKFALN